MSAVFGEERMLIDGALVAVVERSHVSETVNPATEEVLGVCRRRHRARPRRAIGAARRAFDETIVVHRRRPPGALPAPAPGGHDGRTPTSCGP